MPNSHDYERPVLHRSYDGTEIGGPALQPQFEDSGWGSTLSGEPGRVAAFGRLITGKDKDSVEVIAIPILEDTPPEGTLPREIWDEATEQRFADFLEYMREKKMPGTIMQDRLSNRSLADTLRRQPQGLSSWDLVGFGIGILEDDSVDGFERLEGVPQTVFLCEDGRLRLFGSRQKNGLSNTVLDLPKGSLPITGTHEYTPPTGGQGPSVLEFKQQSLEELLVGYMNGTQPFNIYKPLDRKLPRPAKKHFKWLVPIIQENESLKALRTAHAAQSYRGGSATD